MPTRTIDPNDVAGPAPRTVDPNDVVGTVDTSSPPNASPAVVARKPGFFQRFGQAVGVPTSAAEANAARPGLDETIGGPAVTAAHLLYNYGKGIYGAGKDAATGIGEAASNIASGQPVGPNVGKMASHALEFGLRGPLAPFGGNAIQSGGEDQEQGNYLGEAGDIAGGAANVLLAHKAAAPSAETATNKLAFAGGKGTAADFATTLDDLRNASHGQPVHTVDDVMSTVKRAKDGMNSEAGAAMFPIQHMEANPTPIADRIRALITPNMDMTDAGRQMKAEIEAAALDYQKPGWTMGKLDQERMQKNADLASLYSKSPSARYTSEKGNINLAIDRAISDGIRDTVYPQMDQAAGKPPGYFADMKRRQGSLIDLESHLGKRTEDLKDEQARISGAPMLSRDAALGGATGKVGPVDLAMNAVKKPNPLGTANAAAKKGLSTGSTTAKAATATLPARYLTLLPARHPLNQNENQ